MGHELIQGIPDLKEIVDQEPKRVLYDTLYRGLRDTEHPISYRVLMEGSRRLLGSGNPNWVNPTLSRPQAKRYFYELAGDTLHKPLIPEFLSAAGYETRGSYGAIHSVVVNTRYTPENLFWALADTANENGGVTAIYNPVEQFNDGHPRVVGFPRLLHDVQNFNMLGSTEDMHGGDMKSLLMAMELLRRKDIAERIENVNIIVPAWGGARGHRAGQSEVMGDEVFEARFSAVKMADSINAIRARLGEDSPNFKIWTVDIHNDDLPQSVFAEEGVEFESICPMADFAYAVSREIDEQKLQGLALRVVAVDNGAAERTKRFVEQLLINKTNSYQKVEIVIIQKKRNEAGKVEKAEIQKILTAELIDGKVDIKEGSFIATDADHVRTTIDDMIDRGGSAEEDDKCLNELLPNAKYKIAVATHAVMSGGPKLAVTRTGANAVFVSNTLSPDNVLREGGHRVRVVDISGTIFRAVTKQ